MTTPVPSVPAALAALAAPDSAYSLPPSALGPNPSFDFSQILTDQLLGQLSNESALTDPLLGQTGAGALSLPLASGLPALSSGAGLAGSDMTESLIALSLVMLVERLAAPPAASAGAAKTAGTLTSAPTHTADEPNTKWPVSGPITQDFHPGHTGTDIAVPVGTPIPTTLAGRVVFAGWNTEGYGNLVIVENGPYRTYYAHLSQIKVKAGDEVVQGGQIGLSGSTGNSTGPHLHYEVRLNGTPVAPQTLP